MRITMQALTCKYRLLPTKQQHVALASILEDQRQLYNAALQERIDCYRKTGKSRSYMDQCKALTEWRQADDEAASLPLNIQRWTLKRVDDAYENFFLRRRERNGKAGRPRFRSKERWSSFGFAQRTGLSFDGRRIRFKGLPGGLRVHMHRPFRDDVNIHSCTIVKDAKGWSICFQVLAEIESKRPVASSVGIDVGIKTLAATSDGLLIPNPRVARRAERKMRIKQRALARCKRGSKRRQKVRKDLSRLHTKIANTRATGLHQISAMLVGRYDLIAVEALNTKGLASGMLARDVRDAGWSKLREMMHYKAERAGAHFIEVDPDFTSQTCPSCGAVEKKTLAQRTHSCVCGCILDRDVAAARVILSRAVAGPRWLNVAQ
jgi:putative transposase